MKVLLIEDDSGIRRGVSDHFKAQGWDVVEAMDGELGLKIALDDSYDILVLDIMLPRVNGYEICRAVRLEGKQVPILMLTAKSSDKDLVKGFELGATDYVRKPFSLVELTTRVKAHTFTVEDSEIQSDGLFLDLAKLEISIEGRLEKLTDKEAKVLAMLMRQSGKVLTRESILNEVWGNSYLQGVRSVDRCVKTLRKKLGIMDRIKTVRQVGYYFE